MYAWLRELRQNVTSVHSGPDIALDTDMYTVALIARACGLSTTIIIIIINTVDKKKKRKRKRKKKKEEKKEKKRRRKKKIDNSSSGALYIRQASTAALHAQ